MEGYWGSEGIAPRILAALDEDEWYAPADLPPWKEPLVLIGLEAGWAPEPVQTRW
jgi:hypothetical protein